MMTLEITCPFCGATHFVDVTEASWEAYTDGALAQKAFAYLSATEREAIVSGMCPECQADFFGEDEEDEGDDIDACERESLGNNWW